MVAKTIAAGGRLLTRPKETRQNRALLVDDNRSLTSLLLDRLRRDGWEVTWVTDGALALLEIESARPPFDLMVSHLIIPDESVFTLIRAARKSNRGVKVLVFSSVWTVALERKLQTGGCHTLRRPFRMDALVEILHQI